MKKLWLIVAVCLMAGYILLVMWDASTPARPPQAAKLTRTPSLGEFNELRARTKLIEEWAVRQGGKFK